MSHTDALIAHSKYILDSNGVKTEVVRAVDHEIAYGVYPDMTEQGWEKDDWPAVFEKVKAADIVILCTPIWLGEKSSICTKVIERLYSNSTEKNDKGQFFYYGKVGGTLITGNEDGGKHCAAAILYALQHLGFTIPPASEAYWVGEAGPGPSYRDEDSNALSNEFTNRNVTFMSWNLLHMARMLKDAGGFPAYGNNARAWEEGERFGFKKLEGLEKLPFK